MDIVKNSLWGVMRREDKTGFGGNSDALFLGLGAGCRRCLVYEHFIASPILKMFSFMIHCKTRFGKFAQTSCFRIEFCIGFLLLL